MNYPDNIEEKLGFDRIRQMITQKCLGSKGREQADRMKFITSFIELQPLLKQQLEFREILQIEGNFPSQDYIDPSANFNKLKIKGTIIQPEELFDLKIALRTIFEIISYLNKLDREKYPEVCGLMDKLFFPDELYKQINNIIDEKGEIRDKASENLSQIRKKIKKKQSEIFSNINTTLEKARSAGLVNKETEPSIRNGRLVIPVPVTHKRKIKGFIHDESASGQTVYIEPTEVFDSNNAIRELENAEHRELVKILTNFTNMLRPELENLTALVEFMGQIDFIRAKALMAIDLEADMPEVKPIPVINWKNARHPLLYLSHKSQNKTVVPLYLKLNRKNRILVISGPNAGGKSVCLMTAGLLQYMLQCGLLVPMDIDSEMGIFQKIFINMGDEQSLENDLSTYSSHLLSIKYFLENLNSRSLFLIDEFGTGTEPQLGGAIAESALEEMNEKRAFGVITTHYANLKLMAGNNPGIINGAMLYDTKKLKPTYILSIDKPGSSFAFEIARKTGFPEHVLQNAIQKTGTSQLDFDTQLQQLEIDKIELDKKKKELKVADDFLSELIDKYEKLSEELEITREKVLLDAKEEAKTIISNSNRLIEKTIKEIREVQANKEKTKQLRENISKEKEKIEQIKPKARPVKKKEKSKAAETPKSDKTQKIKTGDWVKMEEQDITGQVIELGKGQALISFDTFKVRTPLKKLRIVDQPKPGKKDRPKSPYKNIISSINEKATNFKLSIDLRGKRAEEAISLLRAYLDEALLLNISEVTIVHGKGDGILRDIVRDVLRETNGVKSYKDAHPDRGGHGITYVNFR